MDKETIFYIIFGILALLFSYVWLKFYFQECMSVGHSIVYCIIKM